MKKRILIGADEAGYGPNLGPLVIAASVWSIPLEMTTKTFMEALAPVFRATSWTPNCSHVSLGDSKQLYQPSTGLLTLETGLLTLLSHHHDLPQNLQSLVEQVQLADSNQDLGIHSNAVQPWYSQLSAISLPAFQQVTEINRLSCLAKAALQDQAIELVGLQASIVTESQFNQLVDNLGSKGQLLSKVTLSLVMSLLSRFDLPVEVFCDRQGGRKNYLPVLMDTMPDEWFTQLHASNERSSYQNQTIPARVFHFTVGGDNFAPTGLASMLAKYLRELTMESFNRYWQKTFPNIKFTAGYPLDAKRFRIEIQKACENLGLAETDWWRMR